MYEAFSVISGLVLLVSVFVPGPSATDKLWSGIAGAALVVYGIYVATRTTGTYVFPVAIFILPFAALLYLGVKVFAGGSADKGVGRAPRPGQTSTRVPGPGERSPAELAALAGPRVAPSLTPARPQTGASCQRTGCPRNGWIVRETHCQACGQPTVVPAT